MSELQIVRFPSGDVEYRLSQGQPLQAGDVLTRNGDDWVVKEVGEQADGTTLVVLALAKAGESDEEYAPVALGT